MVSKIIMRKTIYINFDLVLILVEKQTIVHLYQYKKSQLIFLDNVMLIKTKNKLST